MHQYITDIYINATAFARFEIAAKSALEKSLESTISYMANQSNIFTNDTHA